MQMGDMAGDGEAIKTDKTENGHFFNEVNLKQGQKKTPTQSGRMKWRGGETFMFEARKRSNVTCNQISFNSGSPLKLKIGAIYARRSQ